MVGDLSAYASKPKRCMSSSTRVLIVFASIKKKSTGKNQMFFAPLMRKQNLVFVGKILFFGEIQSDLYKLIGRYN